MISYFTDFCLSAFVFKFNRHPVVVLLVQFIIGTCITVFFKNLKSKKTKQKLNLIKKIPLVLTGNLVQLVSFHIQVEKTL